MPQCVIKNSGTHLYFYFLKETHTCHHSPQVPPDTEMPALSVLLRGSSPCQVPALAVGTQEVPTPQEFPHGLEPDSHTE